MELGAGQHPNPAGRRLKDLPGQPLIPGKRFAVAKTRTDLRGDTGNLDGFALKISFNERQVPGKKTAESVLWKGIHGDGVIRRIPCRGEPDMYQSLI